MVKSGKLGIESINAAGNTMQNLDIDKTYPAAWHLPYTITVGASTKDNELASFSCFGKNSVDILAPGTDINSTYFKDAYASSGNLAKNEVWNVVKSEKASFYQEASGKNYINTRVFDIKKVDDDNTYFGFKFRAEVDNKDLGILYVEEFVNNRWENLGGAPLDNMNFDSSKFFKLAKGTTKVRLIAVNINSPSKINLLTVGYGKSTGPYNTMSGTSMAAPYVTASYEYLHKKFPKESNIQLKARLLGGAMRYGDNSSSQSEGIVDLNRSLKNPNPVILTAELKNNKVILNGSFFGDKMGTLWIKDVNVWKKEKVISWKNDEVVVDKKDVNPGYTDIIVDRNSGIDYKNFPDTKIVSDGASRMRMVIVSKDDLWKKVKSLPEKIFDATSVNYNGDIYLIDGVNEKQENNKKIFRYDSKKNMWTTDKVVDNLGNLDVLSDESSSTIIGDKIYVSSYDRIKDDTVILVYDIKSKNMTPLKLNNKPGDKSNATLVSFKDKLYLIGGIYKSSLTAESQAGEGSVSKNVKQSDIWEIDPNTGNCKKIYEFDKEKYDLLAVSTDENIVIVGGKMGDDDDSGQNYVYDGKNISKIDSLPFEKVNRKNATMVSDGKKVLIITDGNRFKYAGLVLDNRSWKPWNYRIGQGILDSFTGVYSDGYAYVIGGLKDSRNIDTVQKISFKTVK